MLINCDLGECLTPNPDAVLMPLIDMANIACGGHVGDRQSMLQTIRLAKQNGVKIGAHPSYVDRVDFGRLSQHLDDDELFDLIYQQVHLLQTLCLDEGAKLEYIKPHGALYHDMIKKANILKVLSGVIQRIDSNLSLVLAARQDYVNHLPVKLLYEVFADRAYQGMVMMPRTAKGAILTDANAIIKQYQTFADNSSFKIDTICFHSDNPASVEALTKIGKR